MTSTIPAVKAALVTVLSAALPETQVIYGSRSAVTTTGPRILTVGRVFGLREPDALTLGSAVERYTVELVCSVSLMTTSQQVADELVLGDYAVAESAIRADITLGLAGSVQAVPFGEIELAEIADDKGHHAALRWNVRTAQTS